MSSSSQTATRPIPLKYKAGNKSQHQNGDGCFVTNLTVDDPTSSNIVRFCMRGQPGGRYPSADQFGVNKESSQTTRIIEGTGTLRYTDDDGRILRMEFREGDIIELPPGSSFNWERGPHEEVLLIEATFIPPWTKEQYHLTKPTGAKPA
jgi:mannose-6-phosphate isomerase-like protein (cupin superfamily)